MTAQSTTSKPSGPLRIASRTPSSTAGIHCLGTEPPWIFSSNTKPEPRGRGFTSMITSPNWPWPPDCFLWRPFWVTGLRIDSR